MITKIIYARGNRLIVIKVCEYRDFDGVADVVDDSLNIHNLDCDVILSKTYKNKFLIEKSDILISVIFLFTFSSD